jgi:hypothetical protein
MAHNQSVVKKNMTFPKKLVEILEKKAKKVGFSFPEYVRYVLLRSVEPEIEEVEFVDEQTEKDIGQALKEYAEGKYVTLRSHKEIHDYFSKLEEKEI